jgi:hypothetical protein
VNGFTHTSHILPKSKDSRPTIKLFVNPNEVFIDEQNDPDHRAMLQLPCFRLNIGWF